MRFGMLAILAAAMTLVMAETVRAQEEEELGGTARHGHPYSTAYTSHIEEGEIELMLMADFTIPSRVRREEGQRNYFSQMLELEYAPTSQLAFEFMMEGFEEVDTADVRFTGFRYEGRYRLFDEKVPLNPMIYAEYEDLDADTRYKMEVSGWVEPPYEEDGDEPERESILESRLVLSEDFGPWNAAFNWITESDLKSGTTAFGYALGFAYVFPGHGADHAHADEGKACEPTDPDDFLRVATVGVELFGGLGDTRRFDVDPSRQEHYLQPSVMLHAGDLMVSFGVAFGLTRDSDDIIRIGVGWEF